MLKQTILERHIVKIQSIDKITHDVVKIKTEKPLGYKFTPGQATEIAIHKNGWSDTKRPFSFTSIPTDNYLEFTIKIYSNRRGVTNELLDLKKNDELIIHEVFGYISFKKKGVFIAGGAGVTPFISILRDLKMKGALAGNMLIFANKTKSDIILESEFRNMLKDDFVNILSDEKVGGYYHGFITENFQQHLLENFNQQFYVCGPPPFMDAILEQLSNLGVNPNNITKEGI